MTEETTNVEDTPQNTEGGAQTSRAQERIQELVAARKAEEDARREADFRAKQALEQNERLQRLLEERLAPKEEEEEWVDPGEKALKENQKLRQELNAFRQQQADKEGVQRVNYEIQQAVAKLQWEDPEKASEMMAREYFAHKGMGISDSFDAKETARRLHEEEKSRKSAWIEAKKQQAEATSSVVAGANSKPVLEPPSSAPAWGTAERKEWDRATASEILSKFRI